VCECVCVCVCVSVVVVVCVMGDEAFRRLPFTWPRAVQKREPREKEEATLEPSPAATVRSTRRVLREPPPPDDQVCHLHLLHLHLHLCAVDEAQTPRVRHSCWPSCRKLTRQKAWIRPASP
jgi:hypothetical protein